VYDLVSVVFKRYPVLVCSVLRFQAYSISLYLHY